MFLLKQIWKLKNKKRNFKDIRKFWTARIVKIIRNIKNDRTEKEFFTEKQNSALRHDKGMFNFRLTRQLNPRRSSIRHQKNSERVKNRGNSFERKDRRKIFSKIPKPRAPVDFKNNAIDKPCKRSLDARKARAVLGQGIFLNFLQFLTIFFCIEQTAPFR